MDAKVNSFLFSSSTSFYLFFILFDVFQNFVNIWIISGVTFFLHHGLRYTDIIYYSFQSNLTLRCKNSCWFGSAFSFPVSFSSNLKTESFIGVLGTSIRSVPTLTGEGINTHTHMQTSYPQRNIFDIPKSADTTNSIFLYYLLSTRKCFKTLSIWSLCIISGLFFFATMVLDMRIQNVIKFNLNVFNYFLFCFLLFCLKFKDMKGGQQLADF